MTALRCKMCGGTITKTGETYGVCDSCGTEITLPKIDNDQQAFLYNRANTARQRCEFDEARELFERIAANDRSDAEAYWQIMLCRYGIDYVCDPMSGERKPTCHRMNLSPVTEDADYLSALKFSDDYTKELYRKEAKKIAAIQEEYLQICRQESPFDVFICFKQTDSMRRETQDCFDAEELYRELTAKGLRVFFSKRTLENKIAVKYEPYIFSALRSAKVMLIVTSSVEHLNSVWVKNEWVRFLELQKKDSSKQLMLVYRNLDPAQLPLELRQRQGQDYSRISAKQNVVDYVLSVCGGEKRKASPKATASVTVENLVKRAAQALEDRLFDETLTHCDRILDMEPENALGHYYRFLASNSATGFSQLTSSDTKWSDDKLLARVRQYGDSDLKSQVEQFLKEWKRGWLYRKVKSLNTKEEIKEKETAIKYLEEIEELGGYQDSRELLLRLRADIKEFERFNAARHSLMKEAKGSGGKGGIYAQKLLEENKDRWDTYQLLKQKHEKYIDYAIASKGAPIVMAIVTLLSLVMLGSVVFTGKPLVSVEGFLLLFGLGVATAHSFDDIFWFSTFCLITGACFAIPLILIYLDFIALWIILAIIFLVCLLLYLIYAGAKKNSNRYWKTLKECVDYETNEIQPIITGFFADVRERYIKILGDLTVFITLKYPLESFPDEAYREKLMTMLKAEFDPEEKKK